MMATRPRPWEARVRGGSIDYFYRQLSNGYANISDTTPGFESWMTGALLSWEIEGRVFFAEYNKRRENNPDTSMSGRGRMHDAFAVWMRTDDGYALALTKEDLGAALLGRGYLTRNSWYRQGVWSPLFSAKP